MVAAERAPIRVVGRYALYDEIAAGGMATIHLGRLLGPVGFARTVAVKRLHPQFAKDPEFVSMFLDEARLAARVQHPNVVATIDVVATEGELFLIMDYVRGESLAKILRVVSGRDERVPPRIAAAIVCGLLHGLHAAHEAKNERGEPLGLVHRDVSPQNVLVGADGIARVLDFGIAKAQGRIQVTRDGQIKGKLAYMPPEQLTGRELSRAVDIYASAVVMWEALTGTRLFKAATEDATLSKILLEAVPPPSAVVPDLPKAFDEVLLRALDRDPAKRHATAKELALALERCCGLASTTEVGDWVETHVGNVLSAREHEIADIESSSAGMSVSQAVGPEADSATGSTSMPSVRAILAAARRGTSDTQASSNASKADAGDSVTVTALAAYDDRAIAPSSSRSRTGITGIFTDSMLMIPVDRKLPILASLAGVAVLVVVVAIVIAGKFAQPESRSSSPPSATAQLPGAASSIAEARTDPNRAIPDPPPVMAASALPDVSPAEPTAPVVRTAPKVALTAAAPAPAPAPKASSAAVKKDCVPPYTIDTSGRRKYKLECM